MGCMVGVAILGQRLMSMNALFVYFFLFVVCLLVSASAVDYLEKLVSEMTNDVSSWTLNYAQSLRRFALFCSHFSSLLIYQL